MKKHISKIYLFILMMILFTENTYAATINLSVDTATILYLVCGSFILVGLVLLVIGRISSHKAPAYDDENDKNDNEIVGLIDKDKINHKFNPDSIFKDIPTFSNKKFFELTSENFKKALIKQEKEITKIAKINIINQSIVDFKNEDKKYIITTEFIINYSEKETTPQKGIKYCVTSEKSKETNSNPLTKCLNCGGKLKENTKNRCIHCGNPIKKENNTPTWEITNIKKMD